MAIGLVGMVEAVFGVDITSAVDVPLTASVVAISATGYSVKTVVCKAFSESLASTVALTIRAMTSSDVSVVQEIKGTRLRIKKTINFSFPIASTYWFLPRLHNSYRCQGLDHAPLYLPPLSSLSITISIRTVR